MELSQSDERFLVPDSEDEELNNCEPWDLILGLKALAAARRQLFAKQKGVMEKDQGKSPKKKQQSIFPSFESEDNASEPQAALVYDTISSDSGSGNSREKQNVTVIERRPPTPSEHIGSLQLSQQAMLVPETMESLSGSGPSLQVSQTGPFIVPDSPTQDHQDSSSSSKEKGGLEVDEEITFNPRLLSTLASQSVEDGKEDSQCLHLRLSPSQPESMQSSGPSDRFEELPGTSSKDEAMPTTPIKNPQMTLSCRKLSLKDPSPSKHQASLPPKATFEMPSVKQQMFFDEDDIEIPSKEKQGEKDLLESENLNVDSSVADSCKSPRPAQNLELFLDTEEEEARKALGTSPGKTGSSKEAGEKHAAENLPSWKEERNLRRQKRRERFMKIIGKASDDEDADKDEGKDVSHMERKEKPKTFIDEAASLIITEEQDSVVMDDEHTLSYEYVPPLDPDEDVDVIKSSLPRTKIQHKAEHTILSQSEEFQGFEKEEEDDPVRQAQVGGRELQNVENVSSLPEPMEIEHERDEHHSEKCVTNGVQSQGERMEEASGGTPYKRDVTVRLSEGSTLLEMTLQDPYTFYGSQSQNIADISAQALSEKPKKIKKIKEMRKVLKKKAPLKQNLASSSTDDADPSKLASKSLKSTERRKQKSALKQSKKQTKTQMAKSKKDSADVSEVAEKSTSNARSATLMPPPVAQSSTKASPGQDAQTLNVTTGSQSENKSNRKGTTVSFSDEHASKGGMLVQESSEHTPGERERKTVREVMALVVTRETTTEVFDSKGQLLRQNVISEVLRTTVLEPPWPSSEVHVSEQIFSPGLSPSRSASTLTSGDLADVSSSSLSRTLSSGSKGSNPSLDAGIHSYPTPAQRTRSMEQTDPSGHDEEYIPATSLATNVTTAGAGKVDTKRLSSGSNTGQDLFGTPNESMIARCDLSHVGTAISSSHSTPVVEPQPHCSHQVAPSTKSRADNANVQRETRTRTSLTKESDKAMDEDEGHSKTEKKGEEEESMQVRTSGKGKQKKGDTPAQSKSKNKVGKRTAKETEAATEMSESARKRPRAEKVQEEMEVEKDEERGGSGVSTGFIVQGAAADSPAGKGDAQAPSRSESQETVATDVSERPFVGLVDIKSKFEIGEQVMGRWNDGCFYPGTLKKMELHNQRFQVRFDDGTQKWVDANGLLLAKELPVGQSVMVMSADGYYECGMIMKHSLEPLKETGKVKVIYHVERDDRVTQKCDRGRLLLSEDQAVCLLTDENLSLSAHLIRSPTKIGDISLDNLVEGKRKPKPTKEQSSTSSAQEKSTTSLDTSVPGIGAGEAPSTRRRPQGPVATSTPTPKQTSRIAKSSNGSSVKHSKASPLGGVVSSPLARRKSSRVKLDLFGSNIQPKSDLFKGKAFLITHIEKTEQQRAEEKRLLQDSSLDTSADDNMEEEAEYHPFVKDQLIALLKTGGGEVMDSFDEEKIKKFGKPNCYVIASEHQRTVKYLQGLASGLTLVSHEWILHSVAQNRLLGLRAFLLPSGISLEKKRLIEWKGPCVQLVGMTMMVVSTREDFTEVWTSILKIAGCHLISKFPPRASKIDPGMDFVISDPTCPANAIRKCRTLEVPVVSSEWVAQCFINNYLVEPNAHEQYKHDYETS